MPLTNYYLDNVPKDIKEKMESISSVNKIRLLDLNKLLSISQEYKYFKDYGHLNIHGDSLVKNYMLSNLVLDYNQ